MAYRLQSLLRIRTTREDRAAADLSVARQAVAEAHREVSNREAELGEYKRTAEARRDRIYAAILGRPITRDELDRAQEGVARIDDEGRLRADNVVLAKRELSERQAAETVAHKAFAEASKERMKITEHRTRWQMDEAREQERLQEIELEDFTGKKSNDDNPRS